MKKTFLNKHAKKVSGRSLIFIILILAFWVPVSSCGGSGEQAPKTRAERVDELFSAYDGDQKAVKEWIKSQLNDPDSYENIETKYLDKKDSILVVTEFTAKNGFGGRLRYLCYAYIDSTGHFMHGEIGQK